MLEGRGRDGPYGPPPAQIPACGTTALGSCLGSDAQALLGVGLLNPAWPQVPFPSLLCRARSSSCLRATRH